jgi:hypothetical protein
MRIVSKQEFYKLPQGTICAKFEPDIFGEPFVKLDTWYDIEDTDPIDYLYIPLWGMVDAQDTYKEGKILHEALTNKTSFKMDYDCSMRDGLFDEDQYYAVWEPEDIQGVIDILERAKRGDGGESDQKRKLEYESEHSLGIRGNQEVRPADQAKDRFMEGLRALNDQKYLIQYWESRPYRDITKRNTQ